MDILIDLIIYLIKQATKPPAGSAPQRLPPTPQEVQRQQATLAQQVQAMQRTIAARQAPKRPGAGRSGRAVQLPPPARVTTSFAPAPVRAAAPPQAVQRVVYQQIPHQILRPKSLADLRSLLLMGEMLSAPVALRDTSTDLVGR
jgi:hypothetical protein